MEINILLLIVILFMIFKIYDGYDKGMVKEIISFVSLIFLCIVVALVGTGLSSYYDGKILNVIVMVFLLAVLGIVHFLINVVFVPAKLIAKLPIVKSLDKVLGIAVGIAETILILWTIYTFAMMMDLGMIGEYILQCTADSRILAWLYEHNQLAGWIQVMVQG
ncbi:MAG: hypothetical protein E7292_09505 [Lachnospiraceae bacterium]|nr:hypothetical protein [Lachnospiraceae bacterium]